MGKSDSCVHIHDWFTLFLAKEANFAIRCNGMRYSRREKINEGMKPSCEIKGRILWVWIWIMNLSFPSLFFFFFGWQGQVQLSVEWPSSKRHAIIELFQFSKRIKEKIMPIKQCLHIKEVRDKLLRSLFFVQHSYSFIHLMYRHVM